MDSLALTDHGVLYGAIEFYKEALKHKIKPIIGLEAYVAPNRLADKRSKIDDSPWHLTLLARNNEGYHNLLKLTTVAHLDGFYYKPRIDRVALGEHAGGLIILSGCLSGEVAQALLRDDYEEARRIVEAYISIVGKNNYFLEIQSHPTLPDQTKINKGLIKIAADIDVPLVATRDSHYLELGDKEAQDAMVCVQTGRLISDTDRLNMTDVDLDFCSVAKIEEFFEESPEAIVNTARIADRCNVELSLGKWIFPDFSVPPKSTPGEYLSKLAEEGLRTKMSPVSEGANERLRYELDIISQKGYATYFLVVADFVAWARAQGIISTTRGSAAGSLVAYALGITTVNPLEYRLPFERFLNPFRPTPPDIDMDFADNRRDEVIAYVKEKYGEDRVAQIVTFGTMQARAAVRDIGRVLGYLYSLCDRVAKMIPVGSQGFHMTIDRALETTPDLKKLYEEDPQVERLLDLARKVEGCVRHASVHAAGVVIAPRPLVEFTPLQREAGGDKLITQYEMHAIEDIGLLKMDFLGIRNLSILGNAVALIEQIHGLKIDLNTIPLDDKKTYKLLAEGETMGLFQLSGSGMTRYLKELKPTSIHDIMAMVALFRPGPMNNIPEFIRRKHNPKLITYMDSRLKPILERSYGILTYQDDVLLIAIELAGYTWEEVDKLRKAIGKKIPAGMAAQKERFISGCQEHGKLPGEKAEDLWKLIEPFAAYGFNKAHAASYGIVAYQTAYLKANFPSEYMNAVLTAESGNLDTVAEIIVECRRMSIEVLPPLLNESFENFTRLDDKHIRFGLAAIKNLGTDIARLIITERQRGGSFESLENFLRRIQSRSFNKKSLESLIKAGALDEWGDRQTLLDNIETLLKYNRGATKAKHAPQDTLFGESGNFLPPLVLQPSSVSAEKSQLLAWERELLGLYLTEHPLQEFANVIQDIVVPWRYLSYYRSGDTVAVMGLVESIRQITTKGGEPMLFVKLSDLGGGGEIVVFPSVLKTTAAVWQKDKPIIVAGRMSDRGETNVVCETVEELRLSALEDTVRRWRKLRYVRREPAASEDEPIEAIDWTPESDSGTIMI
ncbi:DNA polymerase III subunit alpha [Candidatus Uhrbacteria bacterium RIFCSPLOWO2_12_FULL_46_10]|uniref:DNA-directed DNA polymerase n=1 Tax=Candidatus Uhrbacteria bacterium RIFCSPLOWO2_01_FULL_47_25 TaxID=1802402 RepID=A0A1F7UWV6_9BACT|nr:MAG: DNA polymerase III subunit alpha [Candidatus Uhrbacteria bacterium RIFCSPHIGHO2_01_FULL_46_23]OGL70033.1 MAG: DNA polymerase III subunit alpha [Candidatus Uhrbacteria bacterium RIFCSPHIGHO2_02_FULL_47_29]OGL82782.1 MAG: DNA polymerase III subunit alpha [Candidatus Uhrbacteria bacterium RIFCSPLOWO2_01_FULL_47_25]OGL85193.1 MAG: DNA polymerase III subunit alpha [Candidatus Uhrbacteria bacterium RIFCSPLOWO2_02_FULL_46_19]OGL90783.1 MAG: DNA polymerase III subunit alpha [Candidatus Uhrbacte